MLTFNCVISAITTKAIQLNKLLSMRFRTKTYFVLQQTSNNVANVLVGTPGFMTSWSCMLTVLSASLLRWLQNKQFAMYCRCSCIKFFYSCLLTNEWSTKKGGGLEQTFQSGHDFLLKNTALKNWGQVHLILDYLEHLPVLYTQFRSE